MISVTVGVGEQVLERAEAERLVEHLLHDAPPDLAGRDVLGFLVEQLQDLGLGAGAHLLQLHRVAEVGEVGLPQVDLVDQAPVDAQLDRPYVVVDVGDRGLLGRDVARSRKSSAATARHRRSMPRVNPWRGDASARGTPLAAAARTAVGSSGSSTRTGMPTSFATCSPVRPPRSATRLRQKQERLARHLHRAQIVEAELAAHDRRGQRGRDHAHLVAALQHSRGHRPDAGADVDDDRVERLGGEVEHPRAQRLRRRAAPAGPR